MTTLSEPIDFTLPSTSGENFTLSKHGGNFTVVFFYPKDSTPGCTNEVGSFRDLYDQFKALNCEIVGISRDSLKSHENFRTKQNLPYHLLSDKEETVCSLFDVIKMKKNPFAPKASTIVSNDKNMYGKQVRGIERSTFVIDGKGKLRKEWRGVKVPGHAQEVLDFVTSL